ncbi:MAG: serine hydrolase [Cloacibacterium sp.]|jgi:CubicO group peptidase (beta-lactamase class C family)|nr:serine hydrolase [Cloacibacterium sp.]
MPKTSIFKKILLGIATFFAAIILLIYATGYDYLFNGIKLTYLRGEKSATIDDGTFFKKNIISRGFPQEWQKDSLYNKTPLSPALIKNLRQTHTASLLVVKNGKLIHEQYWDSYGTYKQSNSFSVAKAITVMLLGKAIEDGKISNVRQAFTDWYPNFGNGDERAKKMTLLDLASMQSGYDWSEHYKSPFQPNAKAYYGDNLAETTLRRGMKEQPAKRFEYLSGNTQLLGFAVRKAVGIPLAYYASEKLWKPLGMESDAYWITDEYKMEKTFCCVHAIPRDFAKLGQLLLQNGTWNGKQLLSTDFVATITTPTTLSKGAYGAGLWTNYDHAEKHFFFWGILGQYIIVIPEKQLVIVRTGSDQNITTDTKGRSTHVAFLVENIVKLFSKK